jgi:hypothetical protein
MITAERLRDILHYNVGTGTFTWLVDRGSAKAGDTAGYLEKRGYLGISVDGTNYRAHQLAWIYQTGTSPPARIDHINGNPADNRWVNLRAATASQNRANARLPLNSSSGFKGVSWSKHAKKWQAQITVRGRIRHLGYFSSPEAAHVAYFSAARAHFGAFARSA